MSGPWSWWRDLWNANAPAPDLPPMPGVEKTEEARIRSHEFHEVNGKVVSNRAVKVDVKRGGHVHIEGDVASLTINGRRVRFREPT